MHKLQHPTPSEEGATIQAKPPRNSNLEITRIVAMLMIVTFHQVIFTGGKFPDSPDISVMTYSFGSMLGLAGVVVFMLITGYFMANQKITVTKILKLLLEVWFFSIAIRICGVPFMGETLDEEYIKDMLFPILSDEHWFVSSYLIVVILSPLINLCLHHISAKAHLMLCIYIGAFISLHPQPIMSSARTSRAVLAYAIIASLALSAAVAFLVYDGDLGWGWLLQVVVLAAFIAGALLCATAPEGKLFDRLFVFAVCLLIDKARIYLVFKPLDKYLQRFYDWTEKGITKLGEKADASLKRREYIRFHRFETV